MTSLKQDIGEQIGTEQYWLWLFFIFVYTSSFYKFFFQFDG